jgi:8-oxo-dGTP pyrophosphatase MutT (NUDIX family)
MTEMSKLAAVLALICDGPSAQLLLTRRAKDMNVHAGEVAFPGGKAEPHDQSLWHTAVRETWEELGISSSAYQRHGELEFHSTRRGFRVKPYVAKVETQPELQICDREVESARWLPLDYFLEDRRSLTQVFQLDGKEYWAPVYDCLGYRVWGFTARVIVSIANELYGAELRREHRAPEQLVS